MAARPNIVFAHGAWADGSCWSGVIERLQANDYHTTALQFGLKSLSDDVGRLRHVLSLQDGPTVVAAHSYGGQIMTALGENPPNAAALVYIAGFGLDQGESIAALLEQGPPTAAIAASQTDSEGYTWLTESGFVDHFASDVEPVKAKVMHATQQPLHVSTFGEVMGVPAWRSVPSWFMVAANDEVIPPDAERMFAARMGATTVEAKSSHVAMVSHPDDVAALIKTAADTVPG